jgi:N-methylhydantoinase A
VQRGHDPRGFVLVAFGGAGPNHANALARDAGMPTVLVPRSPGIFSATGLLVTDLKRDASLTLLRRLDALDPAEAESAFARLEAEGAAELEREGTSRDEIEFVRQVDLRYVGQSYELTIPYGDGMLDRFHAEHDRVYGFAAPGEPAELVNLRLTTVGRIAKPALVEIAPGGAEPADRREVYFAEEEGFVDTPIYDRYGLGAGAMIEGPAVVEELDSTTLVHPGYRGRVDVYGNLLVTRA